jgi:hypothetical protein
MSTDQQRVNQCIKKEADEILYKKGLLALLNSFGNPHVHGSYALDLMTWRDLDIYLQVDDLSPTDFFALGEKICSFLEPVKMSFRNEVKANTKGLPHGLYWGIYLGNERAGDWKIDIWAVGAAECQRLLPVSDRIKQKLTTAAMEIIMDIKSACWTDPSYRRTYSSMDIYNAVLEKNITTIDEFKEYIKNRK